MWALIKTALSLFNGLKFTWVYVALGAMILGLLGTVYVQSLHCDASKEQLSRRLTAESAAHNATKAELARSVSEVETFRVLLAQAHNATSAVQGSLAEALQRESEAIEAARARKKILDNVVTRFRTEQESEEVVDNATRKAAAVYINRPL